MVRCSAGRRYIHQRNPNHGAHSHYQYELNFLLISQKTGTLKSENKIIPLFVRQNSVIFHFKELKKKKTTYFLPPMIVGYEVLTNIALCDQNISG